jgi:K+-transporting ATPase ATPase C chain
MRVVLDYLRTTSAALRMLIVLTVILGIAYPLAITAIAQIPGLKHRADGSFVTKDGVAVGSSLIGQSFADKDGHALKQYFQPRPSAAGATGYDATASGASNYGPESTVLLNAVCARSAAIADLEGVDGARPYCASGKGSPGQRGDAPASSQVPADAVTASGSGLDPDISPAYAALQQKRVAAARGVTVQKIAALVKKHTADRALGFMGEPAVNVLELNLDLDRTYPMKP